MRTAKKNQLYQKGWTEREIKHTEAILERDLKQDVYFSRIVFWTSLIVIIFANLAVSFVLIPFLIALNKGVLLSVIGLLGLTIGFLYNHLISDTQHLERKHHLAASVILPLLAVANLVLVVMISNKFMSDLGLKNQPHDPWLVGISFAVAFITPYILVRILHLFRKPKVVIRT